MMNFLSHTYVFVVVKQMMKIIHDVHAIFDGNERRRKSHKIVCRTFEWHISWELKGYSHQQAKEKKWKKVQIKQKIATAI